MNYVERNLGKGERIVLDAKISWLTLVPKVIWAVIVFVGLIILNTKVLAEVSAEEAASLILFVKIALSVIALLPLILQLLVNFTTKLAVTNKRVIGKTGILRIATIDYHIDKVDNVAYNAGLWGNLLKYYTVTLTGTSGEKVSIKAIANALKFKSAVTEAVEKHAEEARKAQAAEIAAAMGSKA